MKRRSILLILLLLNILIIGGCSADSSPEHFPAETSIIEKQTEFSAADSLDAATVASDILAEEAAASDQAIPAPVEDVIGIFEGLEGNHTAVFSFDGIETAFHFEEPSVKKILFEAVIGSSYTLSYYFDQETGLYTIYEISES